MKTLAGFATKVLRDEGITEQGGAMIVHFFGVMDALLAYMSKSPEKRFVLGWVSKILVDYIQDADENGEW